MLRIPSVFSRTLLAAAIGGAASVAFAGGVTITPGVGQYGYESDRGLEDDTLYSIGLGYQFDSPWSLELNYLKVETETEVGNVDVDQDMLRLDALYHFDRSGNWQPYLAIGAGETEFESMGANDKQTAINGGGGVKYYFTDNVALRSDLRVINSIDAEMTDVALTFGVNFLLGSVGSKPAPAPAKPVVVDSDNDGVPDSSDRCPQTPAGVNVDSVGCPLDSDNDGVPNYKDQCPDTSAGAKVDAKGCYIMLEEAKEVELKVTFANNSAEVKPEFYGEIEQVATFMREFPLTSVVIEGHTDDRGAESYNQQLSERRAKAVADILSSRFNVDQSRVGYRGYGEARPVADNNTADGRAANRRVVAVVSAKVEKKAMK